MKKLLILLLLVPSLSWGDEKNARELYVNAKSNLMNNGCDFELIFTQITDLLLDLDTSDVKNTLQIANEVINCGNYYKKNTLPVFDKIINDYPSTEVAYNLMNGNEYLSKEYINTALKFIEDGVSSLSSDLKMTISEVEMLRQQLYSCYTVPAGVKEFQDMKVQVKIIVNPDRTVKEAIIKNTAKMTSDPFFKIAGEAALRTFNHPNCSVLMLPEDKYDEWNEINFTFDFSWMFVK